MRKATLCNSNARNKGTQHALLTAVSLLGVSLLSVSFGVTAAQAAIFMQYQNQTSQPPTTQQINSWKQINSLQWGVGRSAPASHVGRGKSSQTPVGYDLLQEKNY